MACRCCISSGTGTLIFAIINIIIVTFAFAIIFGMFVFAAVVSIINLPRDVTYTVSTARHWYHLGFPLCIAYVLTFFITLVFSALLLDGILKKNIRFIKAYFFFGITVVMCTLFGAIGVHTSGYIHFDRIEFSIVFVCYVIYCLLLFMVHRAYTKMESAFLENGQREPKSLIEF